MNTKCFINTNIYHHNNTTAKPWVLANISDKIFWNTNTEPLIYEGLYDYVAERINHEVSDMLTYCEKSSKP